MKLKYLTQSAYNDLYDCISKNLELYSGEDLEWIKNKFKDVKCFRESCIDISLPQLDAKNDDYYNVLAIHNAFKGRITPKQASNPHLWTYLAHCEYSTYTIDRWGRHTMSVDNVKQRFFCGPEEGNRIGLLRNSISRLWWYGYLTYREDAVKPYELTELLLSNSDLCQSVLERKFSMNKNVTVGILTAIQEINDDPKQRNVGAVDNGDYYEWRALCKYINRYGGVTLLDALSVDNIKQISYDFFVDYRKKWGI